MGSHKLQVYLRSTSGSYLMKDILDLTSCNPSILDPQPTIHGYWIQTILSVVPDHALHRSWIQTPLSTDHGSIPHIPWILDPDHTLHGSGTPCFRWSILPSSLIMDPGSTPHHITHGSRTYSPCTQGPDLILRMSWIQAITLMDPGSGPWYPWILDPGSNQEPTPPHTWCPPLGPLPPFPALPLLRQPGPGGGRGRVCGQEGGYWANVPMHAFVIA